MTRRPNVLLLVADDHRASALGAAGDVQARTPSLDALAARGCLFRNAYIMGGAHQAVCVPTRASLHTGRHPFDALAEHDEAGYPRGLAIRPDAPTLGQLFREAGYRCFATGKWHNDWESFRRSFDIGRNVFFGGMSDHDRVPLHQVDRDTERIDKAAASYRKGFSSDLFCAAALEYIENVDESEPFFAYVAFTAPHDPRTPPRPYDGRHDPQSIVLPRNFMSEHPFDNGELEVRDELLADMPRNPAEARRHWADYYGMISHMDDCIGKLIQALEKRGLLSRTIVAYTADHGLGLGSHGLMGKQNLYEHSVKVPLILAGPGVSAGEVCSHLTYSLDLNPTLCELANIEAPSGQYARSFAPQLETPTSEGGRESVFGMYRDCQRMLRKGRWKLLTYSRSMISGSGEFRQQLFDLESDPFEMSDLSTDPKLSGELALLHDWLAQTGAAIGDPLFLRRAPTA